MDQIEKKLSEEKKKIDSIMAPEELEDRLRHALHHTPKRTKRKIPLWIIAAAALCMIVIVSYQYNAFAYYGKKLLGFDEVISDTLTDLNNEGMGQIVDLRIKLADGTDLMIDGIMTDANQLILYYTLSNPDGLADYDSGIFIPYNITGFLTNSFQESGTSLMNEDHTQLKGMYTFEPVSPFSKKLTLNYRQALQNGQWIDDSVSFSYNPNHAMQTEIKQKIKKTLEVDQGEVTFQSITASPMSTVIEGKLNVNNFDRIGLGLHGIELIANGSRVEMVGSRIRSGLGGSKFEISYDALPKQLDSLQLVMKTFVGYQVLNEKVLLPAHEEAMFIIGDKELWVKNMISTGEKVEITIATDEDVVLDGVSIESEKEVTPLDTTVRQHYPEQKDGRSLKERTLLFDTNAVPEYLSIEGMHYEKTYHHVIEIPVH